MHRHGPPRPAERARQHRRQVATTSSSRSSRATSTRSSTQGSGDVKYHLGQTGKFQSRDGKVIPVELAANPSHLETVDPVVEGMVRAKQDLINDPDAFSVLPVLIHGDAAFAGQGVVAETLNFSTIKGYRVGGTIHLIINNQLGFTTAAGLGPLVGVLHRRRQDDRGTDLPRERRRPRGLRAGRPAGVRLPPAVPQGRRHRHGLLPPPRSQRGRRSQLHATAHVQADRRPAVGPQALHRVAGQAGRHLHRGGREGARRLQRPAPGRRWRRPGIAAPEGEVLAKPLPPAGRRAAPRRDRRRPGDARPRSTQPCPAPPEGFHVHPKLAKQFETADQDVRGRRGRLGARRGDGVRLAAARGHRHPLRRPGLAAGARSPSATRSWSTTRPGAEYMPLANLDPDQGKFWIYDSLLSEYAALGFEYGYSVAHKDALVLLGGPVRRLRQRRPDHHRPVHRGGRATSGARRRASRCCCPTGWRARAPSTARLASSGSSPCAPRTTCRCATRRRRPSTSTCCAARCGARSASRS